MKLRTFFFAILLLAAAACGSDKNNKPLSRLAGVQDPILNGLSEQLDKEPSNDSLLFLRAARYYELDAFDEALADINQAVLIDSTIMPYYRLWADVLMDYARPNDSRRAIDVLKKASSINQDDIPTLLKLSEIQLVVRQHSDALGTLDRVLRRDPFNAEAYFMTGRVALDMQDTSRALAAMRKSTQLDVSNADVWIFMGRLLEARNDPQAVQYFDNAIRVDSNNLEAREYKGGVYKKQGKFDQAFEVYRDIIYRNPDYSNAYYDMGLIYLEQDSFQKAYDHFNLAIKTDPLFIRAFYYRGIASEMMGNRDAALADYSQANSMSPNYKDAKEAKERLEKSK